MRSVAVIEPATRSALREAIAYPRLGQSLQDLIMQELLARLKGVTNLGTVARRTCIGPLIAKMISVPFPGRELRT